jgi:hypothetical protein
VPVLVVFVFVSGSEAARGWMVMMADCRKHDLDVK